ncbi:hypothetical protein LguiB_008282 [Lonicera macranthoides]
MERVLRLYMPLFEYFGILNGETIEATESFSDLMWLMALIVSGKELSHMVLRMVFGNYSVENYCDSQIDALKFLMRFIKYRAPMNDDNNTGLHPHNDKSFLTILDQNQVNGLEIQTKEGVSINCSSCR